MTSKDKIVKINLIIIISCIICLLIFENNTNYYEIILGMNLISVVYLKRLDIIENITGIPTKKDL